MGKSNKKEEEVYTYMLKTKSGGIYTGITNNPSRRIKEHKTGKGATYTKKHGVSKILGMIKHKNRSKAYKEERRIKKTLNPLQKLALASKWKKTSSAKKFKTSSAKKFKSSSAKKFKPHFSPKIRKTNSQKSHTRISRSKKSSNRKRYR